MGTLILTSHFLNRLVCAGDSVSFRLNVVRTDETQPVYDITLMIDIFHPIESILDTSFDPGTTTPIDRNETTITTLLNSTRLSYSVDMDLSSSLTFEFGGVVGAMAYTVGFIQLHGVIEYQSIPTNGQVYVQPVDTFPRIHIRNVELFFDLLSTNLEVTEGAVVEVREEAIWRASIEDIAGPSADLILLVERNIYLNITDVLIAQIG